MAMRGYAAFAALVTIGCAATPASAIVVAGSNYSFNWTGVCTDCAGTATASLSLQNYVLGATVTSANLVSFTYNGSNLVASFSFSGANFSGGTIGGSFSGTAGPQQFNISRGGYGFLSSGTAPGNWTVSTPTIAVADFGATSGWTAPLAASVPEPASWAMLVCGFGLAGGAMRRRRAPRVSFAI